MSQSWTKEWKKSTFPRRIWKGTGSLSLVQRRACAEMIKEIRGIGTDTSHSFTMIISEGQEYSPNVQQVRAIIEEVDLYDEYKKYARIALKVIETIVPLGSKIFCTMWSVRMKQAKEIVN